MENFFFFNIARQPAFLSLSNRNVCISLRILSNHYFIAQAWKSNKCLENALLDTTGH